MKEIKRGEIYYADLSPVVGSEQGGIRPVLILQNDMGNKHSPTTIVAAITGRTTKAACRRDGRGADLHSPCGSFPCRSGGDRKSKAEKEIQKS